MLLPGTKPNGNAGRFFIYIQLIGIQFLGVMNWCLSNALWHNRSLALRDQLSDIAFLNQVIREIYRQETTVCERFIFIRIFSRKYFRCSTSSARQLPGSVSDVQMKNNRSLQKSATSYNEVEFFGAGFYVISWLHCNRFARGFEYLSHCAENF